MSRHIRVRTVAVAGFLCALATSFPVTAAQESTGVRLDVRRGLGGYVRSSAPNPAEVVIESDALFRGRIELTTPAPLTRGRNIVEAPVEVPGGSRKLVRLISARASVERVQAVADDGRVLAEVIAPGATELERGEPLIGVLSIADPPATSIRMPVTDQATAVVEVPRDVLSLGSAALMLLSHLVVDGSLGPQLSDHEVEAITAFAIDGGELIVAAERADHLAFLPSRWVERPTGSRNAVGLGGVTIAPASLADAGWTDDGAHWKGALHPVDTFRWSSANQSSSRAMMDALTSSSGFRRPPLGWLLAFILIYVVVAGPVTFLVLAKMRRRELGWVVIPALAIVFAAGAFVAGRGVRSGPTRHGVAFTVSTPDGERQDSLLGVLSSTGGPNSIIIAGAASVEPLGNPYQGFGGARTSYGRDRTSTEFPLSIGDVGMLHVHSIRAKGSDDAGVATIDGSTIKAHVENTYRYTLRNPVVVVGTRSAAVGKDMAPGDDASVRIAARGAGALEDLFTSASLITDPEGRYGRYTLHGRGQPYFVGFPPTGLVTAGQAIGRVATPGTAFLIGWSDISSAFGGEVEGARGPTMVALPLRIRAGHGTLEESVIKAELVTSDGQRPQGYFEGLPAYENVRDATVRFTLPPGASPSRLRARFDQNATLLGGTVYAQPRMVARGGFASPVRQGQASARVRVRFWDPNAERWGSPRALSDAVETSRHVDDEGVVYARFTTNYAHTAQFGVYLMRGVA